ncbi:MAG: TonB-dependent receptor [Paracoccaceae bacterium]|nr:TonB-dependent receptor [Paracoccaceae bacterium]
MNIKVFQRILKAITILTIFPLSATSQDFKLDELTVSANTVPTSINKTGAIVSIIDREEIQNSSGRFLSEVLTNIPSVSLTQNGPLGSPLEMNIRGYGSKYSKVFYDGIDIADVTGVEVKPIIVGIPAHHLNKIEVLQGSQSALYGSEAVGGVVFLETVNSSKSDGSQVEAQYGSFNTRSFSISNGYKVKNTSLDMRFSNFETEGFSAKENSKPGAEKDGYFNREFSVKTFSDFENGATLSLNYLTTFNKGEYDGFMGDAKGYYYTQLNRGVRADLSVQSKENEHKLGLNYFSTSRTQFSPFSSTDYYGNRATLDYKLLRNLNFGRAIIGFSGVGDMVEIAQEEKSVTTLSALASLLAKPVLNTTLDTTVRIDQHSVFGEKITGRMTATYRPSQSLLLKLGGGTGFRAPSLDEMYGQYNTNDLTYYKADANGDFTVVYGNSALKPENSTSFDAGFYYSLDTLGAMLSGSVFNIQVDNAITYDSGDPNDWYDGTYKQLGTKSQRQGINLKLDFALAEESKVGLSYTGTTDEKGKNVSNIPKHIFNLAVSSKVTDKFAVTGDFKVVRDLTGVLSDGSGVVNLKDYNVLNGKIIYQINDNNQVYLNAENLLDENYETAGGFSTSRRAFYVVYKTDF